MFGIPYILCYFASPLLDEQSWANNLQLTQVAG